MIQRPPRSPLFPYTTLFRSVMKSAGVRMPLESYPLQALVSEPVKPCFPCVVMSNAVHAYISQSDKGELVIGSGTDQYVSYSQRGGLPLIEHTLAAICAVFPVFSRLRMLRKWGGIVDVTPDRSAILGKTPVPGLYVNCRSAYISHSDKGELVIGSGTDQYVSYSQRGGLPLIEHTLAAICEVFPVFSRMRMLRKWGGIVDVTPDRSAILGKTPVPGLYVNCGWGTGGFKATPGAAHTLAWTVAKDEPHPINAPFTLERFTTGRLIDEAAAAAVAH